MTVLVTGASGFVGQHLVGRLIAEGERVRALVRPTSETAALVAAGAEVVSADLSSDSPLDDIVAGCDIVHHLAAAHGQGVSEETCQAVNVRGTERLAAAAARANVRRFVLASTRGVHGLIRGGIVNEQTPVAPNTPYRRSKLGAERVVARYGADHGLKYVVVRLPTLAGSGSRTWLELFRAIGRGGFRPIGRGTNRFHMAHVQDAADALRLAAAIPGIDGETFIVGGKAPLALREFLAYVAEALGVRLARIPIPASAYRPLFAVKAVIARARGTPVRPDAAEFWVSDYEIDDGKARRLLGYSPRGSVKEAVEDTVSWYRSHGLL
ncbi:MAG TPA: NAD-dependent epimerase/dehydratase family protein [Vicinamibacterales bacterium]|nr:NAD-dependent epimerase/dehydratase family protein [Vicinamibacterales bacterium]